MQKKAFRFITALTISIFIMICFTNLSMAAQADKTKVKIKKVPAASNFIKKQPIITDGGSSEVYDPGIDLVVSKVVMERGVFGSNPAQRIKIAPYIKNMWRGRTRERIKVLFRSLDYAIWLEGGLGANEEKLAGAIYISDDGTHEFDLVFSVEVDNNNLIPENNEHNNHCQNIHFPPDVTRKVHRCPIRGPHNQMN